MHMSQSDVKEREVATAYKATVNGRDIRIRDAEPDGGQILAEAGFTPAR